MLARNGTAVMFYAFYSEAKAGKTGLTVTLDVWKVTTGGTATQIVTGGGATEVGGGLYRYQLASGSVDVAGEYLAVFKTSTTSVDQQHIPAIWVIDKRINAQVQGCDADTLTASALASDAVAEIQSGLSTAAALTAIGNRLPAALVGGRIDASVGAMAADTLTGSALAATAVAEIQAGLASQSSVDAVKTVVDGTATAVGTIDGVVDGIADGVLLTLGRLPATLIGGAMPAHVVDGDAGMIPPAAADIADAVHDEAVDGAITLRQSVRLANAVLGGKAIGLNTTSAKFRDLADTKDRITAIVDADGNRSAVTRDLT